MRLPSNAITAHFADGRLDVHMAVSYPPEIVFDIDVRNHTATELDNPVWANTTEFPDDWFIWLCGSALTSIATGNKGGVLHFTRKGWKANKAQCRQAFEAVPLNKRRTRMTFDEFEAEMERFFQAVDKRQQSQIAKLQADLKRVQGAKI